MVTGFVGCHCCRHLYEDAIMENPRTRYRILEISTNDMRGPACVEPLTVRYYTTAFRVPTVPRVQHAESTIQHMG